MGFFTQKKPDELKTISDRGIINNAQTREKIQEKSIPSAEQLVNEVVEESKTTCVRTSKENMTCQTNIKFKKV